MSVEEKPQPATAQTAAPNGTAQTAAPSGTAQTAAPNGTAQPAAPNGTAQPAVIAVGGGKGGIGKTLLTANLGIYFAKNKRRVVLVDADLGGSNLHTCLGIDFPEVSLSDFVQRRAPTIEDVIVETGIEGLRLISGAQDFMGSVNIKYTQKLRVLKQIFKIDTEVVLLDLGSGTSFNVLDFFLASNLGVVVMAPEPTSLENSYLFVKSAFYRLLRHREKDAPFRKIIEESMGSRSEKGIRTPYDLIREVSKLDPEKGDTYRACMQAFRPLLVINQVRDQDDAELGQAVRTACRKYFGIDLGYLGHIEYDDAVWQSVRSRTLLVQEQPDSSFAENIWNIGRGITRRIEERQEGGRWNFK
jgi:flagellar biosynthesis protein FlhG